METARVRPRLADKYREPQITWRKLFPYVCLFAAGTFVAEYFSILAGDLFLIKAWGGNLNYLLVFALQAVFYGVAGRLSVPTMTSSKHSVIYNAIACGLFLLSGLGVVFTSQLWQAVSVLVWWAVWPFFQLRIWCAVAFSSSKRLMSYAVGVMLLFSFVIAGVLITILEWVPGLSHRIWVGLTAFFAGFMSLVTSRTFPGILISSHQERKTESLSWLLVTGVMGLVTGMLWGYTEIFLPYIFNFNAGKALLNDISNLYPIILTATGIFAWPGGKMLSYRDSDVGFVFSGTISLLLILVLSYAGQETLILSLTAAFYVPAFSFTCVAAISSAVRRINLFGIRSGWRVAGVLWGTLMLGRALTILFQ